VLATVKGDVHDIGKNIVGVVLGCNNYQVVDLGVMVPCEKILQAARELDADMIGLSGLITPSLDEMVHVAAEMERLDMQVPLLIGGATTSERHTAVRIAPRYHGPIVHVQDASRCPGVVDRLMSTHLRDEFLETNRRRQEDHVASFERQQRKLVPYEEACRHRFQARWEPDCVAQPAFTGCRVLRDFPLSELVPYIDWSPFFMAWELKGKYPRIFDDPRMGAAARELYDHAQQLLREIIARGLVSAHAVYGFWPAAGVEEDILVFTDNARSQVRATFHGLRQQWEKQGQDSFRSLADYVAPRESGLEDYLGGFVLTAGLGAEALAAGYEAAHDDYHAIMVKALADRLAEAFAERLHQQVRREWGYGADEQWTAEDLLAERYRGIRPAPGYPAQPDHTEKTTLFRLLDAERQIGVHMTETLAMQPAASVCGLYFAHPQARYFAVGRLGRDQIERYAARKGIPVSEAEKWLRPYLGYND
jgi:5-methyltetrahydrofolate--homocysteine methyltransferase